MTRISILYVLLLLSSFIWATTALVPPTQARTALARNSSIPLPPSEDPFYSAPPGYQYAAPGTVLRVRNAPALSEEIANCSAIYNILYRTTDSNYKPAWAVTTLLVPLPIPRNSTDSTTVTPGSSLVSFQVAYDSASVDMSPSYTFYDSSTIDPILPVVLGQGWFVNVPDYEGPLASFTAGVQSGHATIDSVRAARDPRFGLSRDAKYALWGYSGGAIASEWAAELQVQYAPELDFAGVAIGGVTPNSTSVLVTVNNSPYAELIPNGLLGVASQDAALEQYLVSQLKSSGPYNASTFLSVRTQNTTVDAANFENEDMFDYFISGSAILQSAVVQATVDRDGIMGYHGVPSMPLFVYKAIQDELSPVADTDALVERYCAVGANILYQRNTVGGHLAEYINGEESALAFLSAVLDGSYAAKYPATGCTVRNVTVAVDSSPL
ncbi:hypothetical protein B7494_g4479 [Chlorociboria aeruginascens]|nr:hypothetical protein B7494_g4479 [Chlorociboria aeruginascens]